jgi:hypothetical protein
MHNLRIWAVWIAATVVGLTPGLAILSAPMIARLLHRLLLPRLEVTPEPQSVLGVLAAVTDWDGKNDPETRHNWLPLFPSAEIKTSPGNFQCWHFFDRPYSVAEAKPVLTALARCTKSDNTQSCDHLFRVPGTQNWPSRKKIEAGRSPTPVFATMSIWPDDWSVRFITLDELRSAIVEKYPADAFDRDAVATNVGEFDWTQRHGELRGFSQNTLRDKLKKTGPDGDRSSAAFGVITYLRGRGLSPEEIFEAISEYETADLPVIDHYFEHPSGFEKSLRADIIRAFTKAPRSDLPPSPVFSIEDDGPLPTKRVIRLGQDYLAYAVDQAELALIEQRAALFEFGDQIVRPRDTNIESKSGAELAERLFRVEVSELRELMTQAANFQRYAKTEKEWVPTNCPEDVAKAYACRNGRRRLRTLTGIISSPTLRSDGSLLYEPGYDATTGLLLVGGNFPEIPGTPTREDALAALGRLKALVSTFPFTDAEHGSKPSADRSVWLAAVLTGVIRRTLPTAPMFAFNAPEPGSGKGKLADMLSIIVSGTAASACTTGSDEEETEKRLGAKLMQGDPVLLLDNCTEPLGGDFLNMLLTQERVSARILGQSKAPTLPSNVLLIATGNNLRVRSDTTRRVLRCTIDPGCERPEERVFERDPVQDARVGRMDYLGAALTVLRAYYSAGRPAQKGQTLGSYEEWCRTVQGALLWLGEPDPLDTRQGIVADDPEREDCEALFGAWHALLGAERVTVKALIDACLGEDPEGRKHDLNEAIKAIAGDGRGEINSKKIGVYLERHRGRITAGKRLERLDNKRGRSVWRLG